MNDHQYENFVAGLCKPGGDILASLTPEKAHLLHMAFALCGEVGELADAIKKHVIYGQELDRENVVEEMGDIEFYLAALRGALLIDRQETIRANEDKLVVRYGDGYSDAAAKERKDKQ